MGITIFIILFIFAPDIAKAILGDLEGGNTLEDVTMVVRVIATAILIVPTLSIYRGYLEGHKFFDIRRWKVAEQYLGISDKGLNVIGNTDEEFFQVVDIPLLRTFHKGQYLMPIDANEVNKMPQLVQNPYYN